MSAVCINYILSFDLQSFRIHTERVLVHLLDLLKMLAQQVNRTKIHLTISHRMLNRVCPTIMLRCCKTPSIRTSLPRHKRSFRAYKSMGKTTMNSMMLLRLIQTHAFHPLTISMNSKMRWAHLLLMARCFRNVTLFSIYKRRHMCRTT